MGFWDCVECGTKAIMGIAFCPHCRKPQPADEAPAAPAPEDGGTQGVASPESQVTTDEGKGGNAKSKH